MKAHIFALSVFALFMAPTCPAHAQPDSSNINGLLARGYQPYAPPYYAPPPRPYAPPPVYQPPNGQTIYMLPGKTVICNTIGNVVQCY